MVHDDESIQVSDRMMESRIFGGGGRVKRYSWHVASGRAGQQAQEAFATGAVGVAQLPRQLHPNRSHSFRDRGC